MAPFLERFIPSLPTGGAAVEMVADWAAAEAASGDGPFVVPGVGVFARHAAAGNILVPVEIHPDYGGWALVTHVHADDFAAGAIAGLPAGWSAPVTPNGAVTVTGTPKVIRVQSGPSDADAAAALLYTTVLADKRHVVVSEFGLDQTNGNGSGELEITSDDVGGIRVRVQPAGPGAGGGLQLQSDDGSLDAAFTDLPSPFEGDPTRRTLLLAFDPVGGADCVSLTVVHWETARLQTSLKRELFLLADSEIDRVGFLCSQNGESSDVYVRFDIRYIAIYREP